MNAKPTISAKPRQRQHLGFLEEYWTRDASGASQYAGHRMVPESAQAIGSENMRELVLPESIEVNRSFSKKRILKAGSLVRRLVSPLQGREI